MPQFRSPKINYVENLNQTLWLFFHSLPTNNRNLTHLCHSLSHSHFCIRCHCFLKGKIGQIIFTQLFYHTLGEVTLTLHLFHEPTLKNQYNAHKDFKRNFHRTNVTFDSWRSPLCGLVNRYPTTLQYLIICRNKQW